MSNLLSRIFYSFYSADFYRYVASSQRSSGFSYLAIIIALTYLVPALLISNRLSSFSFADTQNTELIELREILASAPELQIAEGQLVVSDADSFPVKFAHSALSKDLLVIDPEQNSLIAAQSFILFGAEGVYFHNLEITSLLFNFLGFEMFPKAGFNGDATFQPYKAESYSFSGSDLAEWLESYINGLGRSLLFSVFPLVVLASIFLKFVELYIFTAIARSLARRKQLQITRAQAIKLTAAALMPVLVIKFIDACSLWSSNLLKIPFLSLLLLVFLNYYFINFALDSLKQRYKE